MSNNFKINFMSKRKLAMVFSLIIIAISIGSLVTKGLNLGIDFTGGYLIEAGYQEDANLDKIRSSLAAADFSDAQVQNFGSSKDIIVRIAPRTDINKATIGDNVLEILKTTSDKDVEMRRVEFVGPQVGDELRDDGGIALLVALGGILIYISFRFQFKSAIGAILALVHDVIVTVGVFSITQIEFDLSVLAAVLAVIGYSLNDTVVVLDRIRETFRNVRKTSPEDILNLSINQTIARTLVTSLTTLLVLLALFGATRSVLTDVKANDSNGASPIQTEKWRDHLALLAWMLLPALGIWLLSVRQPIFTNRYLIWSAPALYLMAAAGFVALTRLSRSTALLATGLLLIVLVGDVRALMHQASQPIKPDFQAAASYLAEQYQPGDLVVFHLSYMENNFDYYFPKAYDGWGAPAAASGWTAADIDHQMRTHTSSRGAVWLVLSEAPMWDPQGLVKAWMDANAAHPPQEEVFAHVSVFRYNLKQ